MKDLANLIGQLVGRIELLEPCTYVKSKTDDRWFRVAGREDCGPLRGSPAWGI